MSNYQIPMKGEEITSRLQSIGTKSDTAAEDTAFGRIAKNTETIKTLARRRYDYLKINGLTTSSTSEQVKAALTPIEGTEVVFPTNGDTITNGASISIEILAATSNTFSYIHNNQLVTLVFSLAEGREAVTSKVQTSLLKPMYDFAKINALTGESGNDEIEAAIKQLQTSTTTAPSAGALLVDATSLAPLAVVTDSSSNAPSMTEVFSYTHGGVKYTVEISGEQGALTAKVTTQAVSQRRYDYSVWVELNDTSQMDECLAALTPIGETAPAWPKVGDLLCDASDPATARSVFASVTPIGDTAFNFLFLSYLNDSNAFLLNITMQDNEDGTYSVTEANEVDITTLQSTVTEQGTQIQSHTKDINDTNLRLDLSNRIILVKPKGSEPVNGSFMDICFVAPKGLLKGNEKVKFFRWGKAKYRSYVKFNVNKVDKVYYRKRNGWRALEYYNVCNGNIRFELKPTFELEKIDFEAKHEIPYDYFYIAAKNNGEYMGYLNDFLKQMCYMKFVDGIWYSVLIPNGSRKKELMNAPKSDNPSYFKIPSASFLYGLQIEGKTPIIPFRATYSMRTFINDTPIPIEDANEFTIDLNLYIDYCCCM